MFEDYAAYQDVLSNFETVADLDTYLEVVEEMETFSSENANYGTFDSLGFDDGEELITAYEEYRAMHNTLSSSTDDAFEYLCRLYDLDETYYTNFSDNVDAYTAIAIKAELDDLVATYGDYTTYAATLGFDTFKTYVMDYTDREVYETDVVNDTTCAVDASDMSTIIELLDEILADEAIITMIAELLGLGEEAKKM